MDLRLIGFVIEKHHHGHNNYILDLFFNYRNFVTFSYLLSDKLIKGISQNVYLSVWQMTMSVNA